MRIVALDEVEKTRPDMAGAAGIFKQVPISGRDGSPGFSFRVFTLEPGGHTPYHRHGFEHLNYVIKGRGALITETGEERPIKKGDFALILPDEKHQYRNTSPDEAFIMICAVPKEYE